MKILLYGFKPWGKWQKNITEELLKQLPKRPGLVTHVFDITFDKSVLLKKAYTVKPDVIIGMGQTNRSHLIRIERCAHNVKKRKKHIKGTPITKGGPKKRFTSLKLTPNRLSRISYDAGTFVCNHSIYVFSETEIPFAFLHIPKDINIKTATTFIEQKINETEHLLNNAK